jgi:transposase
MTRKRRVFGAAFKAKMALAAARGDKTTAQLASEVSVHTSQVTSWKKQLLEQAVGLLEDGRLKMEFEWLKKNLPSSPETKRRTPR